MGQLVAKTSDAPGEGDWEESGGRGGGAWGTLAEEGSRSWRRWAWQARAGVGSAQLAGWRGARLACAAARGTEGCHRNNGGVGTFGASAGSGPDAGHPSPPALRSWAVCAGTVCVHGVRAAALRSRPGSAAVCTRRAVRARGRRQERTIRSRSWAYNGRGCFRRSRRVRCPGVGPPI